MVNAICATTYHMYHNCWCSVCCIQFQNHTTHCVSNYRVHWKGPQIWVVIQYCLKYASHNVCMVLHQTACVPEVLCVSCGEEVQVSGVTSYVVAHTGVLVTVARRASWSNRAWYARSARSTRVAWATRSTRATSPAFSRWSCETGMRQLAW